MQKVYSIPAVLFLIAHVHAEAQQLECANPVVETELLRTSSSQGACHAGCVWCNPEIPPDATVCNFISWAEKRCVQLPDNTWDCQVTVTPDSRLCLRQEFTQCVWLPPWTGRTYELQVWLKVETCDLDDNPNCPACDQKQIKRTVANKQCLTTDSFCA